MPFVLEPFSEILLLEAFLINLIFFYLLQMSFLLLEGLFRLILLDLFIFFLYFLIFPFLFLLILILFVFHDHANAIIFCWLSHLSNQIYVRWAIWPFFKFRLLSWFLYSWFIMRWFDDSRNFIVGWFLVWIFIDAGRRAWFFAFFVGKWSSCHTAVIKLRVVHRVIHAERNHRTSFGHRARP